MAEDFYQKAKEQRLRPEDCPARLGERAVARELGSLAKVAGAVWSAGPEGELVRLVGDLCHRDGPGRMHSHPIEVGFWG